MQGCLNHTEPRSLVVKGIVHSKMTSLSLFTQPYVMFPGLSSSNMTTEYNKCDLYSLDRLIFLVGCDRTVQTDRNKWWKEGSGKVLELRLNSLPPEAQSSCPQVYRIQLYLLKPCNSFEMLKIPLKE